jgi:Tat protein translocase TatB subunit
MFGTLGGPELFLIFVVALIVFGPRKLPEIGKSLGRMMAEFRKASNEFRATIESEVEAEKIRDAIRIDAPRLEAGAPATAAPEATPAAIWPAPSEPGSGPAVEPGPGQGASDATSPAHGAAASPAPDTVSRAPDAKPIEPK